MVEDGDVSPRSNPGSNDGEDSTNCGAEELSPLAFPVCVNPENAETIGVEEVRCKRHTVGVAYRYYKSNVVKGLDTSTLVSVAVDGYKSTCFNMFCYLLAMPRHAVPRGSLALGQPSSQECWVLARCRDVTDPFLESLCTIGIDPIVQDEHEINLWVGDNGKDAQKMSFCTSSFLWRRGGPNILWSPGRPSVTSECHSNDNMVRAVKTALVTVSVLLTPKSLYGGKNPTTKTVSYFVHNICHGKDM
jgi:hypothetical protein